jgi:hypothetical protein
MNYVQRLEAIVQNLIKSKNVNSFDIAEERGADTLSHALLDMEESLKVMEGLIPKLYTNDLSEDDVDSILFEIGEELRHILYHLNDTKFYNYLIGENNK